MFENTRNCRYRSSNIIVFSVFVILRKPFKRGKWPASFISLNLDDTQSCPTLRDLVDWSPPGSSLHGISQARILKWISISSSRGSFWPRDQTCIIFNSCTTGGFFTTEPPGRDSNLGLGICGWFWATKGCLQLMKMVVVGRVNVFEYLLCLLTCMASGKLLEFYASESPVKWR